MTALKQYERLEATALWHETPDAQRREVYVSLGKTSLILRHVRTEEPLVHWSLPALRRLNPGRMPAIYAPGRDGGERLEIDDDIFVAALDKLLAAIDRRKPRPGRVRWVLAGLIAAAMLGLGLFWLPGALVRHVSAVAPPSTRAAIGRALLGQITALAGAPCRTAPADTALALLARRVEAAAEPAQLAPGRPALRILVLPGGMVASALLPGGILLLNRSSVELPEAPEVPAGHALAALAASPDPFADFLAQAGGMTAFRLLTTGRVGTAALRAQARRILTAAPPRPAAPLLLEAFRRAGLPATPYAYDLDVTGETTLALIEGDPFRDRPYRPVLSDDQWIALQAVCEG